MCKTLITSACVIFLGLLTAQKATANQPGTNTAAANTAIKWITVEEAEKLITKEPRKLFIYIYTNQCGWCKRMDAHTFQAENVAAYLNAYFYPVKLDAEEKKPITMGGYTYNFKPEYRFHELAVRILNGQMSYPTIAYMDETLQLVTVVPGYHPPEELRPILVFIAQDYYKKMNWETFMQEWPQIMQAMNN
jgi:thioredoxin-related protein